MKLADQANNKKEAFENGLREFQNQLIEDAFLDPKIPLLNSTRSGSVESCYKPTWYTKLHDLLEGFIEYSQDDIENEQFAELKLALLPKELRLYLFDFSSTANHATTQPILTLSIPVEVLDLERGTFRFKKKMTYHLTPDVYQSKWKVY